MEPPSGIMTEIIESSEGNTYGQIDYLDYLSSFSPQQQAEIIGQELFSIIKQSVNNIEMKKNIFNILMASETKALWLASTEFQITDDFSLNNLVMTYIISFVQNNPHLSKEDVEIYNHLCASMTTICMSNVT